MAALEETRLAKDDALQQQARGGPRAAGDRRREAVPRRGGRQPGLKNDPELEELRKTLLKEPLAFFKTLREQLQADHDTRPEALGAAGFGGV